MSTIQNMEQRRERGLRDARFLEDIRILRPLHDYEERSLRKCLALVSEMDEKIAAAQLTTRRNAGWTNGRWL